ncbi:hypothetical protein TSUD_79250 [Trifolium subterraneum]|uniref:NPH3 domain-containing protein n=1 Tax=Trifolium subterraneum TaxID=3900 RepID=A0A2Z6MAF1_TRISU|nr:hypothetical protein TSUD_79250 [Trifolium subterraneum]
MSNPKLAAVSSRITMKSLQVAQATDPESQPDRTDQVSDKSIVIPNKHVTIADSIKSEHSRFVAPRIPTDFSVQVQETTYNVHKYPLLSKCGYIGRLEVQPLISNSGNVLNLENFPGGSETFETILKFCYGLPIDFNSDNVAALRCASEFLEMTEELEDGNLISKTEAFLTFVVLSSWKDTVTVLKSCENLSPWAENIQIVRRCCDSIAWKASKNELTSEDATSNQESWWFNDVATLRIDHFMRIISAIKAKGIKPETIGKCIMQYAKRWLPGIMSNSPENCTMQDIDVVQRIVEYFLMHEKQQLQQKSGKLNRLMDNYLAEVATDPNLSITKFQVLAELLPEYTRSLDDGLYRAIDTYLKTHPSLTDHDRRRLCKIMNCEKLSLDACIHAAQNDRLPLRTVVQVLFAEQVKMRAAMQEKEPAHSGINSEQDVNQTSASMDIKTLKTELENVKSKMVGLQNDYFELQEEYKKLSSNDKPRNHSSSWGLNWRKIKNSFHVRTTGGETRDEQEIPTSPNHTRRRSAPKRRLSVS